MLEERYSWGALRLRQIKMGAGFWELKAGSIPKKIYAFHEKFKVFEL